MSDTLAILRHEFDAEEGSFLLRLRCDLVWDPAAFTRLTDAMAVCCREHEGAAMLPRWVAEGFWYTHWFVPHWSKNDAFPRPHPAPYYEAAYERLWDLAFWLFAGAKPGLGDAEGAAS